MTIVYIIFAALMFFSIKSSVETIKKAGYTYFEFIKEIYTKQFNAYLYAFGLLLFIVILSMTVSLNIEYFPSFFKWSWLSLINENSTNMIAKPIVDSKSIFGPHQLVFIVIFCIILTLTLPLLAYSEEVSFRSLKTGLTHILKSSFLFALIHIPMGIPLFIVPILFIMGIIFSLIYRKKFLSYNFSEKTIHEDIEKSNKIATMHVSRIHSIYNLMLIISGSIIVIIIS